MNSFLAARDQPQGAAAREQTGTTGLRGRPPAVPCGGAWRTTLENVVFENQGGSGSHWYHWNQRLELIKMVGELATLAAFKATKKAKNSEDEKSLLCLLFSAERGEGERERERGRPDPTGRRRRKPGPEKE